MIEFEFELQDGRRCVVGWDDVRNSYFGKVIGLLAEGNDGTEAIIVHVGANFAEIQQLIDLDWALRRAVGLTNNVIPLNISVQMAPLNPDHRIREQTAA